MDLLGSEMQQRFNIGEEVFVDNYGFVTSCSVLPSLHEGHVIGKISSPSLLHHKQILKGWGLQLNWFHFFKLVFLCWLIGLSRCLPAVENLEHMEELWTSKVFLNSLSVTTLSCTSRCFTKTIYYAAWTNTSKWLFHEDWVEPWRPYKQAMVSFYALVSLFTKIDSFVVISFSSIHW